MRYDIDSINKRKEKIKILKRIATIIFVIVVYNMILVGISIIDGIEPLSLFGYQAYIITSDSMKPEIKNGDVILVRKIEEKDLRENDVITFMEEGQNITHRIVEISEIDGKKEFKTKGDNNEIQDNKMVLYENIKGKVIMKIPLLGNIVLWMKDQFIILIVLFIVLLICFYSIQRKEKSEIRRRKKEIENKKQ